MWYPHVTVATVVEDDGRFLLVHEHADGLRVYNQPAGHLEPDETLLEAAVRETREETGWLVEPTGVLGISHYTSPHNGITYVRTSVVARPVERLAEEPPNFEIIEALWMTHNEIRAKRDRLRSPMVLDDVERFLAGTRFPLELIREYR